MAPTRSASHLVSGTSSSASRPATRKAKRASVSVGIAVEPEGKRHQAPDLAAEVLAAGAVAVDDRGHRGRVEQALALERARCQHLASERLQRPAEPSGERNREALLAPGKDLLRQQRRQRLAQQTLLGKAADLHPPRQREGELGDLLVEKGDPQLQRM